jgi:putative protein-disulfide isomerase
LKPLLLYCYDVYCGWCYGFSPVVTAVVSKYGHRFGIEILSGGMIPAENAKPVEFIAGFVAKEYKRVEEITGRKFGEDYLWHMFNPDKSDWHPQSETPAIALCIFKDLQQEKQLQFASDLQYALNYEGRDLTDDEAYRHLLIKYGMDEKDFYQKLHSEEYKERAHYEFSLCRQLNITGFPVLLLQTSDTKLYMVAQGFTHQDDVFARIERILTELTNDE